MIQTRPIQKLVRIRKYDPEYTKSLRLINGVQTGQTSVDDAEYQDALAKIDAGEPTINGINDVTFILNGEFSFDISSKFDDMMSSSNPIADSIKQTKVGGVLLGNGVIGNAVKTGIEMLPGDYNISKSVHSLLYGGFDWTAQKVWKSTEPLDVTLNLLVDPELSTEKQMKCLIEVMKKKKKKKIDELGLFSVPGVKFSSKVLDLLKSCSDSLDSFTGWQTNKFLTEATDNSIAEESRSMTILVGKMTFEDVTITSIRPMVDTDFKESGFPATLRFELKFSTNKLITDETIRDIFEGITYREYNGIVQKGLDWIKEKEREFEDAGGEV